MNEEGTGAVPYVLLGETRRRHLADWARAAVLRWRTRCGLVGEPGSEPPILAEAYTRYTDSPAFFWDEAICFEVTRQQTSMLEILLEPRALPPLAGLTATGMDFRDLRIGRDSMAETLCLRLLRALAAELLGAPANTLTMIRRLTVGLDADIDRTVQRHPSVQVTVGEAPAELLLRLPPSVAMSVLPPPRTSFGLPEPLTRRSAIVREQSVALEQVLGEVEVPLADLHHLRLHDVLVLETSLSTGGELRMQGRRVAATRIGKKDHRRAVQMQATQNKRASR